MENAISILVYFILSEGIRFWMFLSYQKTLEKYLNSIINLKEENERLKLLLELRTK